MEGFTSVSMADKKEDFATPIRELVQNSLDASREAGNKKCEINVYIDEISLDEIPHITEYKRALRLAIKTAEEQCSYNANSQQRVKAIEKTLRQSRVKVLMFSDNGIGMSKDGLDAILTGYSRKGGDAEKATGSFGVGHLSSYSLSSLRYVLYATKHRAENGDTQALFTGQPILAGHKDDGQRGNAGRIVKKKPDSEEDPDFEYTDKMPGFIAPKINALDKGTVVVVLGLSKKWNEDAEYAIVSNFFHAIAHDALRITVQQNGKRKEISTDEVERLIAQNADKKRTDPGKILPGSAVHQAWQATTEPNAQKNIKLSNSDIVYVCIRSEKDANSAIILVRNGMVVARHDRMLSVHMKDLRNAADFEPFTAVIDVDQESAPKLFGLVKGAESQHHDKLQTEVLDPEDEKRLKILLKELSEKIKDHLNPIDREAFVLPLFPASDKATEIGTDGGKTRGQGKRAKTQKKRKNLQKIKDPVRGTPKNRPRPVVVSRNLNATVPVRYADAGDKWRVTLRVTPDSVDDRDDVYLSICLGEDSDNDQALSPQTFASIELDGRELDVHPSPLQVKLGHLNPGQAYNIVAMIQKPAHIGSMKVALLPLLGLKRNLPVNTE